MKIHTKFRRKFRRKWPLAFGLIALLLLCIDPSVANAAEGCDSIDNDGQNGIDDPAATVAVA